MARHHDRQRAIRRMGLRCARVGQQQPPRRRKRALRTGSAVAGIIDRIVGQAAKGIEGRGRFVHATRRSIEAARRFAIRYAAISGTRASARASGGSGVARISGRHGIAGPGLAATGALNRVRTGTTESSTRAEERTPVGARMCPAPTR